MNKNYIIYLGMTCAD